MTKIAYLDCVTGIAGDMFLGSLVDGGVPLEYLIEQLKGLNIDHEYELTQEKVQRNGQQATKVHVKLIEQHYPIDEQRRQGKERGRGRKNHHGVETAAQASHKSHHHHHTPARHLPEIEGMIQEANLPSRVTQWSLDIFRRLAVAEGAVHGVPPEKVHFHEVGATDAIVDIVGSCLGLDYLDIETLYCSALPTGGGTVYAAHGRLPVPVPAVLKLWESRQVPIYSNKIDKELVTPTGAAIAVTLVKSFGQPPNMVLEKVGLGAGSQELSIPNILRLWIGENMTEKKTVMLT
ncbi:MAG: nickel pincer cofactor biosynthesis protein LarC [Crocosphaera sp.]|nr:nickel pincer cofactor biosynthesis protein LarC [Crocosphaera sp.]